MNVPTLTRSVTKNAAFDLRRTIQCLLVEVFIIVSYNDTIEAYDHKMYTQSNLKNQTSWL